MLHGSNDSEALIDVLVEIFDSNKRFNDLGAIFSTTLTRNISDEFSIKCRNQLSGAILRLTKAIQTTLPALNFFQVENFINYMVALKNGLWAETSASDKYAEMTKDLPFNRTSESFAEQLREGLTLLLKGIYSEN